MINPTLDRTKENNLKTIKLGVRGEMRLPKGIARQLKLRQGTKLAIITAGNGIYLVPPQHIPKEQHYFYTDEWQEKERQADKELKAGRVEKFLDVDSLIRNLRRV